MEGIFNFKRSVKGTVWVDESFFIEADNYEEALEKAKNYLENCLDDSDESTVCWETFNQMSPSENDGDVTVKLYDENWRLIGDNTPKEKPKNEPVKIYVFKWETDADGTVDETVEYFRDYSDALIRFKEVQDSVLEEYDSVAEREPKRIAKEESWTNDEGYFRVSYNGMSYISEELYLLIEILK